LHSGRLFVYGYLSASLLQWLMLKASKRFTLAVRCAGCGQSGSALWEERLDRFWKSDAKRKLIRLSEGFRRGESPNAPGELQIICYRCKAAVPSQSFV
jgi:hypothetical protein